MDVALALEEIGWRQGAQLRAATEMEAALHRLDIQPGHTTDAELEADDAAIRPALVDGQAPTATRQNTPASSAGKFPERSTP